MLVKFHSSTSGEIMMFAETARQTVGILHKEALARGVITTEQLPESIALIEAALARAKAERPPIDDDQPLPIGMAQRLLPFLELLQRTLGKDGYVMWEAPADFGAEGGK
jgi:hypothetical protein